MQNDEIQHRKALENEQQLIEYLKQKTMSNLSISGKITDILKAETGTSKAGKEWTKQNFVIDTGAQFNPSICFNLFGDEKIAMLSGFSVGQDIEVLFNVSSREFGGKYYHNIDAWKLKSLEQETQPAGVTEDENSDLPF